MRAFLCWLLIVCLALPGNGVVRPAASSSRADVVAAYALSNPGDIIKIPGGTLDLTAGDLTFSGRYVIGPGRNHATPLNVTGGKIILTKHATHLTMLIGMRFTQNRAHIAIGGSSSARMAIIGDFYLHSGGAAQMASQTVNGALWYDYLIEAPTPHDSDVFPFNLGGAGTEGQTSWESAHTMGTADTTGEANNYFEDGEFKGLLEVAGDIDNGARNVYRHVTFRDSSLVYHGGGSGSSGNDTSSYGGRHLEVYNCTFIRESNAVAVNKWVWWRGGAGVFANNSVARAESPDGSSFPDKPELRLTVGCPGAYPLAFQVGQTVFSPESSPSNPLLIFGNTGAGAVDSNFIRVGENPNNSCGTPSNYIQSGRDYVTSNTWGWEAYTYPHPLRATAAAAVAEANGGSGSATMNATTVNATTITVGP